MDFQAGHGALWPYLPGGVQTHERLFNCPAQSAPPRPFMDGTGRVTGQSNFGYSLNPNMATTTVIKAGAGTIAPDLDWDVRLVQIRRTDHKILIFEDITDGQLRTSLR